MIACGTQINNTDDLHKFVREGDLTKMFRSLQFLPRTLGHTSEPYSVMQHILFGLAWYDRSLLIDSPEVVKRKMIAWALHDLHECFTGDVPRPEKCACVKQKQEHFDAALTMRLDLAIRGDDLSCALAEVKRHDTLVIHEEFYVIGFPGWTPEMDGCAPKRNSVLESIRKVQGRLVREWKEPFGRMTRAPYALERLVTGDPVMTFEKILDAACTEE